MASTRTNSFPMLADARFMSLTTYRKSGKAVPTPVWFAQVDDTLYVFTQDNSGKVKRLRHTAKVEIAPCDSRGKILGESMTANATLHYDGSPEAQAANDALNKKYGLIKRLFGLYYSLRGHEAAYILVTPT